MFERISGRTQVDDNCINALLRSCTEARVTTSIVKTSHTVNVAAQNKDDDAPLPRLHGVSLAQGRRLLPELPLCGQPLMRCRTPGQHTRFGEGAFSTRNRAFARYVIARIEALYSSTRTTE